MKLVSPVFVTWAIALLACTLALTSQELHRKFEYKHSFKGPHLANKRGHVLFWSIHGGAFASQDQVRLTASIRSQKGSMWNTIPYEQQDWEAELALRINGRGRVGADGLAMWFRTEPGTEGNVFGANDQWNGLGIFFDSFDNDGGSNNPYILVMMNDGTIQYNHTNDGLYQQLGGCMRDFRNRPFPVHIKVTYIKKELTVYFDYGNSAQPMYELCMQAVGVNLPSKGYFGFSAATGGLADDHDVLNFQVTSLLPPPEKEQVPAVKEEDLKQFQTTFDDYSQKVDQQREEYRKAHPDPYMTPEEEFESFQDRNVRLVLEGQTQMTALVAELKERLEKISSDGLAAPAPVGNDAGVNSENAQVVAQVQAQLHQINQRQERFSSILEDLKNKPVPSGGGSDHSSQIEQLQQSLEQLQQEVRIVAEARGAPPAATSQQTCPKADCATVTTVMLIAGLEVVLFIVFLIIQKRIFAASQKKLW